MIQCAMVVHDRADEIHHVNKVPSSTEQCSPEERHVYHNSHCAYHECADSWLDYGAEGV